MTRKTILIIEDDVELFRVFATRLESEGFAVVGAIGAREALMKLRNQAFFCVICDLKLSEGTGDEVIRIVRDPRRKDPNLATPIILISSSIQPEMAVTLKGQVQGALVKPFAFEDLLAKVNSFKPNAPVLDSSAQKLTRS